MQVRYIGDEELIHAHAHSLQKSFHKICSSTERKKERGSICGFGRGAKERMEIVDEAAVSKGSDPSPGQTSIYIYSKHYV